MTPRERYRATFHYQDRDRAPIYDFGFWKETIVGWYAQGLPAWVEKSYDHLTTEKFFGMDPHPRWAGVHNDLLPAFEHKVLEDRGDHEIVRQGDGVTVLRKKFMGSIPQHHGHLLQDRASWEEHYKPRLNPDTPGRVQPNADAMNPDYPVPITVSGGSLFGKIRDWMGIEEVSYLVYDDPALFEEMVETVTVLIEENLRRAFAQGLVADAAHFWEDMCYNAGPLLSPRHFKEYLVPRYRRITDILHQNNVDVVIVDCDGKIDELIPLWLDVGVNCMFPIEIGAWKADPIQMRRAYGKDLLLQGGFDKRILAGPLDGIEAEVRRLAPLVEEGGFIGYCDHRVPPDVPLRHYLHYLKLVREIWGHDVALVPMHPNAEALLAGVAVES